MNCEQIPELLPWLLNGTLDGGERAEVERHLRSCAACRQELTETRMAWETFDPHVATDRLVAYAWGDDGVDREQVQRHLETCPQCAAELELAGISRQLEASEDQKVPLLVPAARRQPAPARIWRSSAIAASLVGLIAATGWIESAQRAHSLGAELAAHQAAPAPSPPSAAVTAGAVRQAQERAADLARRNAKLESTVAVLQEKTKDIEAHLGALQKGAAAAVAGKGLESLADVPSASPPPVSSVERGAPAGAAAVPYGPYTFFSLASNHEGSFDRYELAVLDGAGKERHRVRDLHPAEAEFRFLLKGALARGSYTLQLYGVRAGERVLLDSYAIRVV